MTQTTNSLGRFGRFGTTAIAYLSLAVGAGLSTAFNVVHTIDVRGQLLDTWDIVVAVAGPGMVVLMVELFVSTLWTGQRWYMHLIRWLGCTMVAGIAMRMSWTHGHAFLVSRGQTGDVSALMPLAVDTLAIMATALLLSSRMSRREVDMAGHLSKVMDTVDSMMTPGFDMSKAVLPLHTEDVDIEWTSRADADSIWDTLASSLDTPAPVLPYVPGDAPVSGAPAGQAVTRTIPGEDMDVAIRAMLDLSLDTARIKKDVSEVWGVTTKTVGRHMDKILA